MQREIIKHEIKKLIDNSNWSYQTKRDLKIIVDVSRTVEEVAVGFMIYLEWLPNYR